MRGSSRSLVLAAVTLAALAPEPVRHAPRGRVPMKSKAAAKRHAPRGGGRPDPVELTSWPVELVACTGRLWARGWNAVRP